MSGQKIEQLRVHEGFAAENAEKRIAVLFCLSDRPIESLQFDGIPLLHVHPTALAAQIAGIDDRQIEERRKKLAPFDAAFEPFDREHSFDTEVPCEFPERTELGRLEDANDEGWKHGDQGRCFRSDVLTD